MPSVAQPTSTAFYITGGTLPADASSYVERAADRDLLSSLLSGEYCYVLNSRQMGKSSLSVRTIARLREEGVRTAFVDLTRIGAQNVSAEQWYAGLLAETGRALGLRTEFLAHWKANQDLPPVQRYFGAIREAAIPGMDSPLVIFVDEIDAVRSLAFSADEFFAAVRACHNARTEDPAYKRLTFCLVGSATPADLISDTRMSPFNIGRRIELRDFTGAEASPLAKGLGPNGTSLLSRILDWTNGHPYLTQRLCRACVEQEAPTTKDVDRICSELFLTHTARESDDNLSFVRNRLLRGEADIASLLDTYGKMGRGRSVPDDETNPLTSILKLSGVARVEGGQLRVRNRIYQHVFDRRWVETHMPDAELRRQRAAYRRGLVRAAAVASAVILVMLLLSVMSYRNAQVAVSARDEARKATRREAAQKQQTRRLLYTADMNGAEAAIDNGSGARAKEILAAYIPGPGEEDLRGWEWRHLWRRANRGDSLRTIRMPGGGIWAMAANRDRSRLALAMYDGSIRLLDTRAGSSIRIASHAGGPATCVEFSPDGRLIASGGADRMLRVWDVATGRQVTPPRRHAFAVRSLAFSPNGKEVATGTFPGLTAAAVTRPSPRDEAAARAITIWSARTPNLVRSVRLLSAEGAYSLAYSPDGRMLAVGCVDPVVELLDPVRGRVVQTLFGHNLPVRALAWSPDGRMLATGGNEALVKLWKISKSEARIVAELRGHGGIIQSAQFSPTGRQLATTGDDGTIRLWDVDTRGPLTHEQGRLVGHADAVRGLAYTPGSDRLFSASLDSTVRVWVTSGDPSAERWGPVSGAGVTFSPDGRELAVSAATGNGDGVVRFFDTATGRLLGKRIVLSATASSTQYTAEGAYIITATGTWRPSAKTENRADVWDARTGILRATLRTQKESFTGVTTDPSGRLIAVGDGSGVVRLWDGHTFAPIAEQTMGRLFVGHGGFTQDGSRLVVPSGQDTVLIWDTKQQRCVGPTLQHPSKSHLVLTSGVTPDGRYIASADFNGSLHVWDMKDPAKPVDSVLTENVATAVGMAFAPGGGSRTLAAGYQDGTVRLWSLATWPARPVAILRGPTSGIGSVAFSQDGKLLAAGCADNHVYIWRSDEDGAARKGFLDGPR